MKTGILSPADDHQSNPHHVPEVGKGMMGGKTSDRRTIPLCTLHHVEYHNSGRETFSAAHNIDYELVISRLNKIYEEVCSSPVRDEPYIGFNISEIRLLKSVYECSMDFLMDEMPDINWNSAQQIKVYFHETYRLMLENVKITTFSDLAEQFPEGSTQKDLLTRITMYLRLKFSVKNYLDCILRHEVDGLVYLRDVNGVWRLPNKQPLSYNEEISNTITCMSPEISKYFKSNLQ
jgi:hypothetical protein